MSIDLSLSRLFLLLPDLTYTRPTLHIAGTNGKDSVSALLTSILLSSASPMRVGRFNSPHLVSILDCITLSDLPVSQAVYTHARKQVEDADNARGTNLTGFELLTMTALRVFENERVDLVVLEVGMGGRLDATNVVPDGCILVSALAAVDLDHQAFLGDTVALIAREKAGIARAGKPFVLGRQIHPEVEEIIKEVLAQVGGVLVPALDVQLAEEEGHWSLFDMDPSEEIAPPPQPVTFIMHSFPDPIHALLPLHGARQLENLGTALGVIDALLFCAHPDEAASSLNLITRITPETIVKGIQNVKWPGRLSFHTVSIPLPNPTNAVESVDLVVLADGAHNPASARTLGAYITRLLSLTQTQIQTQTMSATSSSSLQTPNPDPNLYTVPITHILSLSHSPPKTPLQTLSPILPPIVTQPSLPLHLPIGSSSSLHPTRPIPDTSVLVSVSAPASVALLRFTPPEGMPWVKSVPPKEMEEAVRKVVPDLGDGDVWVAPDEDGDGEQERGRNKVLEDALRWAAAKQVEVERRARGGQAENEKRRMKGLVVLAGSLYLVADFYLLLEGRL